MLLTNQVFLIGKIIICISANRNSIPMPTTSKSWIRGPPHTLTCESFQSYNSRRFYPLLHCGYTVTFIQCTIKLIWKLRPDKCPRKVNREIVNTMVESFGKIFNGIKPVYDGKKSMYTKDPLPIGHDRIELEVVMPGDSAVDRKFKVAIKVLFFFCH